MCVCVCTCMYTFTYYPERGVSEVGDGKRPRDMARTEGRKEVRREGMEGWTEWKHRRNGKTEGTKE